MRRYEFQARVWLYPGDAAWHFVSVPKSESALIAAAQVNKKRRGWGAVRVKVAVGAAHWETSIFPDKKSGTYLLPIKLSIRKKVGIFAGDLVIILLALAGQ